MLGLSRIRLAVAIVMTLLPSVCLFGQNAKPELKSGIIVGTAIDVNGDPVPNATVELKRLESDDRLTVTTPESGSFEFRDLQPGVSYEITITARDFADWNSFSMTLEPGQFIANRGLDLVFGNFAVGTAERMGASLAQEFIIGKFTKRSGHMQ